jgi:hypothetical protein
MTILCADTLLNLIDLIADGVTVTEASRAVGCSPKSKVVFKWLSDSESAGEFGARPDAASPWCITRGERDPEFFHILYREAVIAGRVARSIRRTPIRAELEAKLRAKRMEPPKQPGYVPPRVQVFKPSDEPTNPVTRDLPAPPPPRPSYAYKKAPALDGVQRESGPPLDGRFSVVSDRPKSLQERRAGKVEITDLGVRRW